MADFYAGANGVLRARANGMGDQKKSPSANAPGLGGPPPEAVRPRGGFAWFRGSRSGVPAELTG